MRRLKLLQLNYVQLTGDYKYLSKRLRWLCWRGFPLNFIPQDFINQQNMVSIDLRHSNLVQVWEDSRLLDKLKILNLSHSHHLTLSPDFSKLPHLEHLILKDCRSLSVIHQSIGNLRTLASVNLKDCIMLKDLPRSFYTLKSIETLVLSGCSKFEKLVEDIGEMISLTTLLVGGTAISEVPSYMGRLKNLNYLSQQGLIRQILRNPKVPKDYFSALLLGFTSLKNMNLGSCIFHSLPKLGGLSNLEYLRFNNCTNLPASRNLPTSLKELEVDHCTALETVQNFSETENFPGMENEAHSKTLIRIERCIDHITAAVWKNIIQVLFRECSIPSILANISSSNELVPAMRGGTSTLCMHSDPSLKRYIRFIQETTGWTASGDGSIFLPAYNFLKLFVYVRKSDQVFCQVPKLTGFNLKAFTVRIVCSFSSDEGICPSGISVFVTNHTKLIRYVVLPIHRTAITSHEVIWQLNLSNSEFNLKGGDFVEVEVVTGAGFGVKKTGVTLIWENPKFLHPYQH